MIEAPTGFGRYYPRFLRGTASFYNLDVVTRTGSKTGARGTPAGSGVVRRARQFQLIPALPVAAPLSLPAPKSSAGVARKFLLIEDDPSIRDAIIASLEEIGDRDVAVADDGQAGLALIDSLRPSVVLLDLMLPVADGFDVLAELRKRPREARPGRVVVISGMSGSLSGVALLKLGADRVLPKPFTLSQFEAAINS